MEMSSATRLFLYCWVCVAVLAAFAESARTDPEHEEERLPRSKRSTSCAPRFQLNPGHTACLSGREKSAVSADDQKLIVKLHNDFRAAADPPAADMMLLRWDDEVAMLAQKWADNCVLTHDKNGQRNIPGRITVDQNIAMRAKDWTMVITLWHSEKSRFIYGNKSMNDIWPNIGHYTSMMWARKTLVGCGMNTCDDITFHVCDYALAGNLMGAIEKPYKQGAPCSDCPDHCVYSNKLCDCHLTCLNLGALDPKTCTCKCAVGSSLYTPPNCALNCTGTKDAGFCPGKGGKCPAHTPWCPHKCDLCPYGEEGYSGPPPRGTGTKLAAWDHMVGFALLAAWVQIRVLF